MKTKGKTLIVISCILIVLGIILLMFKNVNEEKEKYITNASVDEINEYNKVMNEYYFRYLGDSHKNAFDDSLSCAKQILYSNAVEENVALDEEKFNIGVEFDYKVYKYPKEKLEDDINQIYNSNILYNYIDTSTEGDILVIDENYVYYSLPKDEYVFIVKNISSSDKETKVILYEYLVTNGNKKKLTACLENGNIPKDIKINNIYEYVFEENNGELKVISKSTQPKK